MKNQKVNKGLYILVALAVIMLTVLGACTTPTPTTTTPATTTKPPTTTTTATPTPTPTTTTPAPTTTTPAPTTQTITIGAILMMTGPLGVWGVPLSQTYQMQIDEINAAGGIKVGNTTYKLALKVEDDAYNAEKALGALTKLLTQDKVPILITSMVGGIQQNQNTALTQANAIGFDQSAASALTSDLTRIWRAVECDEYRAPAQMLQIMKDYPNLKRVVSLNSNNAVGNNTAAAFKVSVAKYAPNWQLLDTVQIADGTKDFNPVLTKMLAMNPELIYTAAFQPGNVAVFLKQAREAGYSGPIMWNSTADASVLNPIAGAQNVTNFYIPYSDPNVSPEVKALNDRYKAKYGAISSLTTYGRDVIPIIVQTIQQAGGIDPAKMMNALNTGTYTSLAGPAKWTGKQTFGINHQWLAGIQVAVFTNGEVTKISNITTAEMLKLLGEQ